MASVGGPFSRTPFSNGLDLQPHSERTIPILPSSVSITAKSDDAMDTSQSQSIAMASPVIHSPNGNQAQEQTSPSLNEHASNSQSLTNGGSSQPVGAAAAVQQPKVVQTAFIHKLYRYVHEPAGTCIWSITDRAAACSKTKAYHTSYPGLAQTKALSCLPRPSSRRS